MTLYEKCQQSGDTSIHDDYVYICQNGSATVEVPLLGKQIKSICTTGDNDIAVDEVANDTKVREWIGRYSDNVIKDALAENGEWNEEELSDRNTNIRRLIWTLAWDLFDSENPNECLAIDELQNQPVL